FGPPEAPARMETRSAEKPSARICARACGPARMVRCLDLVMRVGRALSAGNYKAFAQADLLPKPQSPFTPKHSATRGGDMQRSVVLAGVLDAVLGGGVWTVAASSLPVAEERASQPAQSELSPSLAQETPRSLTTMPVIGTNDETVGRVDAVMR